MGKIHSIKIQPDSREEDRFMKILQGVGVKPSGVICKLGEFFGTPYNEYILSDGLYQQIQEHLDEKGEI